MVKRIIAVAILLLAMSSVSFAWLCPTGQVMVGDQPPKCLPATVATPTATATATATATPTATPT